MQLIQVDKINKSFDGKVVLDNVSFGVEQGSFVSIFGSNGSGKTTLLNIIAGLINADKGKVIWADEVLKNKVAYVFQNYRETLFPWKTVAENIALPLKLEGKNREFCQKKINGLISKFSISIDLDKYPYQLSGGQQQIVAILRAVITEPKLLLLDEPFSALDFKIRIELQEILLKIWEQMKITIIFISHDMDEAIYMADKLLLISKNKTISELGIEIRRPRETNVVTTVNFNAIKNKIINEITNGSN